MPKVTTRPKSFESLLFVISGPVEVAYGCGQGIRGVKARFVFQVLDNLCHSANLLLGSPAVTDDRFLYLQGRILKDFNAVLNGCDQRGSPSVTNLQRALHVLSKEYVLYGHFLGAIVIHNLHHRLEDVVDSLIKRDVS